MVIEDFIL